MAEHSNLPPFGNWKVEENVPYTEFFDKARKDKGEKSNSNNPRQKQEQKVQEVVLRSYEQRRTGDASAYVGRLPESPPHHVAGRRADVELRVHHPHHHHAISPAGNGVEMMVPRDREVLSDLDSTVQMVNSEYPLHHRDAANSSGTSRKAATSGAGSDPSAEHSSLHRHHPSRTGARGGGVSGSPYRSSQGVAPMTPGRSRLGSVTRSSETPDHGATVPRFGDWDERDPASAANFTQIFNKVREERQDGEGSGPADTRGTAQSNGQSQYADQSSKSCCCFPWS